ncbi:hypothetical protein [Macrococcus lamae]|uniref:hypothetical protein n=1 Tax=Macrococcus lamae TaxID=198484 RepID=UPI00140E1367|nr:hypothetical protein [Macrococcus lamae]
MRKDNGFLLVDALLSLSTVTIICAVLIPMLHEMNITYKKSMEELTDYHNFYVYVKSGGAVIEREGYLCRATNDTICIQKR